MQKTFETPVLTVLGQAEQVVMGASIGGDDLPYELAPDFEFEQD